MLTGGAERVASGDFSNPVISSGENEFSDLAESFNRMMRQLSEYREKLIISQKIAAWQTIGRKIAHEVKNPLTPISIAIDDLRQSYHEQSPAYEKILDECSETIKGEVNRLKKLIDQFSSFAKMPDPELIDIPAEKFLRDITVLFREEMADGRLVIDNRLDKKPIYLDPDQMRQVIINLIKNSLEAGGRQTNLILDREENSFLAVVEDDGPGMPDKIIEEGPAPYYSTKEKGSGLGLIICQRIVYDHGGTMSIENKLEGGARVIITLPLRNG
jgi:nitrogen fixation/metabolism regulation signal transduction histidine kinase